MNPELVYVPVYNPWVVYGQPIAPYPGFSLLGALGSFIGSSFGPLAIRFGLGIATTAFMHTPFGLLAWGLDWLAHVRTLPWFELLFAQRYGSRLGFATWRSASVFARRMEWCAVE